MNESQYLKKTQDFSLVLGGPLYQLLIRARLEDSALGHLKQRIIVITLFAWLPLFLLSIETEILVMCHREILGR